MTRFRDFDAARAEANREPLSFRLAGRDFTTHSYLPAGPLLDLAVNGDKEGVEAFQAYAEFLDAYIVERDALKAALREVEWPTVAAVVSWLVAEATAAPLGDASPSDESQPPPGDTSNDTSTLAAAGTSSP